jgi:hypothetical protein
MHVNEFVLHPLSIVGSVLPVMFYFSLYAMPCITLMHHANACITLLAWVMERLVIHLCWNHTVSKSHLFLVSLTWQMRVQ